MPHEAKKQEISGKTTLGGVVSDYPAAVPVMLKYGLHCVGCHVAAFETVEQGGRAHGMGKEQIEEMLKEMNEAIESDNGQGRGQENG